MRGHAAASSVVTSSRSMHGRRERTAEVSRTLYAEQPLKNLPNLNNG